MLNWLKERQTRSQTARDLYGSIVTQARQPGLYRDFGVPDTPRGRFELIALHTALVLARLQQDGATATPLARALSEAFVTDMDGNMRELTFSDLAVPREVKKVAAALFDRHSALMAALAAKDGHPEALEDALARDLAYLAGEGATPVRFPELARYFHAVSRQLAAQSHDALAAGGLSWPALD